MLLTHMQVIHKFMHPFVDFCNGKHYFYYNCSSVAFTAALSCHMLYWLSEVGTQELQLQPFYGSLDFVQDYPGELTPER